MVDKKLKRQRRAAKGRARIRRLRIARLCVSRTARHLYAQVIMEAEKGDKVLASASTLDREVRSRLLEKDTKESEMAGRMVLSNVKSAAVVGGMVAKRALAVGVSRVAFDRSGLKYHGRVKALAEAAREAGLLF